MTVKIRQEKVDAVEEIKSRVSVAPLTLFFDYRGLTVSQVSELRSEIRKANGKMGVYKNTLSRLALSSLGISTPESYVKGPTAIINSSADDATEIAKIVVKFVKDNDVVTLKGGILEGQAVNESIVNSLASLPSREVLIAQTVGAIKAPLTNLVYALSSPISGMVNVLNSIKDKKNGGDS